MDPSNLISLDTSELFKALGEVFSRAEILISQGVKFAEIAIPQIASIVEKYPDPIILKCVVNLLQKTSDKFTAVTKPPDFFHKITANLVTDNDVIHAFIFQIITVFVDSVHPELPVLKYVIDGCESPMFEKRLAAKNTAIEICKKYDYFCSQVIRSIRMPEIIDIIPHMTRSNKVINQVIHHINRNLNMGNEYIIELIDATIEFSIKINAFPTTTFSRLMKLLNDNIENKDFVIHVLKSMRRLNNVLLPYQEGAILEFCSRNIKERDVKSPFLRLMSSINLTDPTLNLTEFDNGNVATAYAETLPHTAEAGSVICRIIGQFSSDFADPKLFRRIITTLFPVQHILSDDDQDYLSEIFRKFILMSMEHQEAIGEFFLEINEQEAPFYIQLSDATRDLTDTLKLGFIRIYMLLGMEIEPYLVPKDEGEIGIIAFSIGKYQEANKYFGNKQGDLFYDAMKAFTDGEIAFLTGNYSKASLCYGQAEAAFTANGTMYTLQMTVANIRSYIASLLVQIEVMSQAPNVDFTQYKTMLYGVDTLISNSRLLPSASLLLSPSIDEASHTAAVEITEQASEFLESLKVGNSSEMTNILTTFHIVPRAFFCRDFPIEVTALNNLNAEQVVPPAIDMIVGVNFTGKIKNERYRDARVFVQLANEIGAFTAPTDIPSYGEFTVNDGIQLVRITNKKIYQMTVVVWIKAILRDSDQEYIVSSSVIRLPIRENNQ